MQLVELYRSTKRACEHRAFVLRAVGIASEIAAIEDEFVLFVEVGSVETARDQLNRYYVENAVPTVKPLPPPVFGFSWIAPTVYTLALLAVAFLAGRDFFGFDWYGAGALSSAALGKNEWWRTSTALTLHVDHQHLLSNVGFGALFSYAAARLIGSGATLFGTITAAILGNLLDTLLAPQNHVSIGASTIVFATLGLVSAYSWRLQFAGRLGWAHRWAPLVVGVMLLGFLGANGENTDVLAHLSGFFVGATSGAAFALVARRTLSRTSFQWAAGTIAVALLLIGWIVGLGNLP